VFIATVAGGLLAAPLAAEAQPGAKAYRIGYLSMASGPSAARESFLQGLRELGYAEGRTFVMEYRWAAGKSERLPDLASDLVSSKVDVIVTGGTPATIAATRATRTIPIVFASMASPVERGIITSFARPGGNVTGLALETGTKILQLLKEAAPKASRVGLLYDPAVWRARPIEAHFQERAILAKPLGLTLQWVPVRDVNDVEQAFTRLAKSTDGLLLENSTSLLAAQQRICALALQRRLPAVGQAGGFADAGCLLGYGENLADMFRRAAIIVDKILKGAKPAEVPVELPSKFELVINLKTAKALGLTISPSLLQRADQVLE